MTTTTTTSTTTEISYDYDYIVIGGGSGGVSSAKRAATLYHKKVAIVEAQAWGGTCVNVGCVPKKIMFQAAALLEATNHDSVHYEIKHPGSSGSGDGQEEQKVSSSRATLDWKTLKHKRDAYIQRLNQIYLNGLKSAGVDIVQGWGRFVDAHTISVAKEDGSIQNITAQHILIAVGGKPMLPSDTPGIPEHVITSDGFFALEEQPASVAVVGAGYIAVELAGVLNTLGTTPTHLIVRKGQALRSFDPDISNFLDAQMVHQGIQIHRHTDGVAKIELAADGQKKIVTMVRGGETVTVDCVLVAPGRVPNTDALDLVKAGVVTNRSGEIVVDEFQTTNIHHIHAVGDVCNLGYELTPMAIAAGRRLADRLFGGGTGMEGVAKVSYENVPTVVFSHPTIGTIGLTEPEAIQKYGVDNLTIYKSTFVNLYYSMFNLEPSDKPKTLVKLICAGTTQQVVGLHIIGMAADEMLQGFGVAMKMGATKADFDACIAIHPTAAEEVVTLGTWGTSPPFSGAVTSPLYGAAAPEPPLEHSGGGVSSKM